MSNDFIPASRRVTGDDLERLRGKMGLTTGEACWMYGFSLTKWSKIARIEATSPLSKPTLSLLARALAKRSDINPFLEMPTAHEVYDRLLAVNPSMDKKRLSIFFGCEASSGYRWITTNGEISPALARLFYVFKLLYDEAKAVGPKALHEMIEEWELMVKEEAAGRGIFDIYVKGRWSQKSKNGDLKNQSSSSTKNLPSTIFGKATCGFDVETMRERLGISTMDACWVFGFSSLKWTRLIGKDANIPISNVSLALLIRVLRAHPEISLLPENQDARTVFDAIRSIDQTVDRKRMALLFGCEASSGYRWLTTNASMGPSLTRLLNVFMMQLKEVGGSSRKSLALLEEWVSMVKDEANTRGATNFFQTGRWVPVDEKPRKRKLRRKVSAFKPLVAVSASATTQPGSGMFDLRVGDSGVGRVSKVSEGHQQNHENHENHENHGRASSLGQPLTPEAAFTKPLLSSQGRVRVKRADVVR